VLYFEVIAAWNRFSNTYSGFNAVKNNETMKYYGVITGDVVSSTKYEKKEVLLNGLKKSFEEINKSVLNNKARFEISRGDSFQVLIPSAEETLRFAILLKSKLRWLSVYRYDKDFRMIMSSSGRRDSRRPILIPTHHLWDGRISIGIGTVDLIMPKLSESSGEAFSLSGREFDKMKERRQSLIISTPWGTLNDEFKVESQLANAIMSRWTQTGSEAMYYYLLRKNTTQKEISEFIKISQSSVNRRLIAANYDAVLTFIERFESLISLNTTI
jgi:hypothetical protein